MPLVDHLLVFGFVVLWPIVGWRGYRRFMRRVTDGVPGARTRVYLQTIAEQWLLVAAVVGWWFHEGRTPAKLGLGFGPATPTIIGAIVTAAVLTALVDQMDRIRKLEPAKLEKLRVSLGHAAPLLPTTDGEQAIFRVLALTAGICEEILFRGYLLWYLAAGIGAWPAMFVGAALFGVAHCYQGAKGTLKTGIGGLVLVFLYCSTGSLLWPMALHAAMDLQGGAVGRVLQRARSAS